MEKIDTKTIEEVDTLLKKTNQEHRKNTNSKRFNPALTPNEKIIFAYQYHKIMNGTSLLEILKETYNVDQETSKLISNFIVLNKMIRKYPDCTKEYKGNFEKSRDQLNLMLKSSLKRITQDYNHQNWLEPFDENVLFSSKFSSITSYPSIDGGYITFDKEKATKVKLAIVERSIFPAKCIVEGAYKHIADNTFEKYVKSIKGGINNGPK